MSSRTVLAVLLVVGLVLASPAAQVGQANGQVRFCRYDSAGEIMRSHEDPASVTPAETIAFEPQAALAYWRPGKSLNVFLFPDQQSAEGYADGGSVRSLEHGEHPFAYLTLVLDKDDRPSSGQFSAGAGKGGKTQRSGVILDELTAYSAPSPERPRVKFGLKGSFNQRLWVQEYAIEVDTPIQTY